MTKAGEIPAWRRVEILEAQLKALRGERDEAWRTINQIEDVLADFGIPVTSPLVDAVARLADGSPLAGEDD